MKKIVYISMLFSAFCFGQNLAGGDYDVRTGNNRSWQDMQIGTVFEEVPITGTPYLEEIYKMGVATVNGKRIRLLMRYDALNDQIELIDKNQKSFNLLKKEDIYVEFDGRIYKAIPMVENGEKVLGYVNPLTEGEVVLYFKPRKRFVQAEKPENGYDDYEPPKFVADNSFLIQRDGKAIESIRLAKGPLMRYLRDKSDAVKEYVDINELDLKTVEDAVQLINYYNSLK